MHMYSFYVSQSMLFVSFDLASSKPLKRYLICDFRVSILETFESPPYDWLSTCNLNIYTEEGARNAFAHGGGVGEFSGLQDSKYPFIRKKNQILSLVTGQENRLSNEKIKRQRNQNQNLTSKARRESEIDQQSCDWLFSRGLLDPHSKILK